MLLGEERDVLLVRGSVGMGLESLFVAGVLWNLKTALEC